MKIEKFINKILCGSSEEILKQIPDNSIHFVFTSPPYNVGMNYENHQDEMNKLDYLNMLEKVFRECYRILVRGGRIAINSPACLAQTRYSKIGFLSVSIHNLLEKIGFLPMAWIYWFKIIDQSKNSTSWGSWKSPSCPAIRDSGDEYLIVMAKETFKLEGNKKDIDITKDEFINYTKSRWEILPETRYRDFHPAPFPLELPLRAIKLFTYKGNIVLDPFCGIGTTCLAAKKLGRKYIGIDISEKYCRIARERLSQEFFDFGIQRKER